jgi:predicted ATP-binding protein involved in virulence
MRVKELKLHNFRGIKNLHLVFNTDKNVVVIVGINGIGKSSILDCINLLVRYHVKNGDIYYPADRNGVFFKNSSLIEPSENDWMSKSDIQIGEDITINEIVVSEAGNEVTWKIAKSKTNDADEYIGQVYGQSREQIIDNYKINFTNHYFYHLSNRQVIDSKKFVSVTLSQIDYVGGKQSFSVIEGNQGNKGEKIADFEDFSKWFKEAENLENEQRLSDDIEYRHPVLAAVRNATYSLLGEGYNHLAFKRAIDTMIVKKSGQEIALELLSDGEKSLLAMVGHLSKNLAEDSKELDNPLKASAIVLIDEIELHLHPEWQQMIIPRLTKTFPNCQFIVTTHSPQVLSHVDPECIHILDYDGDNVIVKRPESSYGLDSNRILEDILGVSKRPQEIQERMLELFRTINSNDLESAKDIVRELGDRIGINEPELVKAEATIKRREIIGR